MVRAIILRWHFKEFQCTEQTTVSQQDFSCFPSVSTLEHYSAEAREMSVIKLRQPQTSKGFSFPVLQKLHISTFRV